MPREYGGRFCAYSTVTAVERSDSKREGVLREQVFSLQRPFSWGETPRNAEAGYRGTICVRAADRTICFASECFRKGTPRQLGCEAFKDSYNKRERVVRWDIDRDPVLIDSRQDLCDLHDCHCDRNQVEPERWPGRMARISCVQFGDGKSRRLGA
jgi:hypothetical protein